MELTPVGKRMNNRLERLPVRGKAVFDARRHFSVDAPRYQPGFLQVTQLVGKHLLRDAWQQLLQARKVERVIRRQTGNDGQFPLAAQHGQSGRDVAGWNRKV